MTASTEAILHWFISCMPLVVGLFDLSTGDGYVLPLGPEHSYQTSLWLYVFAGKVVYWAVADTALLNWANLSWKRVSVCLFVHEHRNALGLLEKLHIVWLIAVGKHRSSFNACVVDRRVFYRPSLSIICELIYLFIHSFISIVVSDSSF